MRRPKLILRAIRRRLCIPSYYPDYGFVRRSTPRDYCQSLSSATGQRRYKQIYPEQKSSFNVPRNVSSVSALSQSVPERLGFSFYDVPTLNISETYIGQVLNCKIICCPNEWGHESYCILGADKRVIQLKGTEFRAEHRSIIRSKRTDSTIPEATWVLSRFYDAYFRWFTQILPRTLLANEQGWADTILWPPDQGIKPYMRDSLKMLGIRPEGNRISLEIPLIKCERLNIIESDTFCGPLLKKVSQALRGGLASRAPNRRVYICRQKARWRRCVNEDKVWALLKDAGYERYCMEELDFPDQVALMSEASVIIGLHGAGLANMIFCQEGAHVIEIIDPGRPNPHYYALASCLGHSYWVLEGRPVDAKADPVYRDLSVDIPELSDVIKRVASRQE